MTEEGRMKIAKNEDGRWGRSKAIRRVRSGKTSDGRHWQYFSSIVFLDNIRIKQKSK
jgi:hypothetical protein